MASRVHQWKRRLPQDGIQLKDLEIGVRGLREEVSRRKSLIKAKVDALEEEKLLEDVQNCIESSEAIMKVTTTTIYEEIQSPSVAELPGGDFPLANRRKRTASLKTNSPIVAQIPATRNPQSRDSNIKHQGSSDSDSDSIIDPEPDFQDDDLPPAVYLEIITRLQRDVQHQMAAGEYQQAEMTHKKVMKHSAEREKQLKIPFGDQTGMNETLAEIYLKQGQLDKSKRILNRLLIQEKEETDRKWRLYYALATVYKEQSRLPEAEKFAKRAYGGRERRLGKEHALVGESVDLLVKIYEQQGEMETADALRKIYTHKPIVRPMPVFSRLVQELPSPPPVQELPSPRAPTPVKSLHHFQKQQPPQMPLPPPPPQFLRASQKSRQLPSPKDLQSPKALEIPASPVHSQGAMSPTPSRVDGPQMFKNGVRWAPDAWGADPSGIDAPTKSGETPLIAAIALGDEELVKFMLQRGADREARCADDTTPLMHAVIHGSESISELLLNSGAQVDGTTAGWTPLHKAIDISSLGMAKLLITHGANLEARSPRVFIPRKRSLPLMKTGPSSDDDASSDTEPSWTVLLRAATNGHETIVRLVLDSGAEIEAKTASNLTPLMCAAEGKHDAIVDILLNRNADVNAEDEFGWRPLHRAIVKRGSEPVARRLLEHNADVNAKCVYRKTPLHYAIEKNDENMARFLLGSGADIEARDIAERTPLHTAIECRLEMMVRLLLDSGADAAAMDRGGHDALGAANHVLRKSPEIITLLAKHKKKTKQRRESETRDSLTPSHRRQGSLSSTSTSLTKTSSTLTKASSTSSWWSRKQKGRSDGSR